MIRQHRSKPLPLKKLDAVIPRLPAQFPTLSKMQEDVRKQQHGYNGELQVDYYLDNLAPMYDILRDVYLRQNNKNFQIDSCIIGDYAVYNADSKNYNGTIEFNTTLRQLTRSDGTIESGFEYPITQVTNQAFHLQNWLTQHYFTQIPITSFAVIADPSTIVKVQGSQEKVAKYVTHSAEVSNLIMAYERQLARSGAKKLPAKLIGQAILHESGQFDRDLYKIYGIKPSDILPGVICPKCRLLGMKRVHSGWWCPKCMQKHTNAHLNALNDYLMLIKNTITNSECMRFLGLKNRGVATRILKKSGLAYNEKQRSWYKKK
ncbi:Nuclease-related domain-containing protein [Lentibacillus persicus]|uniref:Nuclease-related domain-containing protein n=1 Tax=Lentibacillus persicus TaxID=640948 RepID=A0A1I1XYG3_9BACI|nr:NERD domain-containing protein [Lentibacillus persicus]SFE12417.1 Nuclease-related domain-containing protein [Lentibacillus persicus]